MHQGVEARILGMVVVLTCLFTPASRAQLANSVWPDYGGGMRNTHQSTAQGPNSLPGILWSYSIPQGTGGNSNLAHSQPSIAPDGSIYFATYSFGSDSIIALESNGALRYQLNLGKIGRWITLDAHGHLDYTRFASSTNLYQRNQSDGSIVWQWGSFNSPFSVDVQTSPAIANNGTIYANSDGGDLRSFTAAGSNTWTSVGGGPYSNPAIADNGNIVTGGSAVRAADPSGSTLWSYPADVSAHFTSPAIDSAGNIYVGQVFGSKLVSLTSGGAQRWTRSGIGGAPAIGPDGTIYAGYLGSIYALNPANGNTIWSYATGDIDEFGAEGITIDGDGDLFLSTVSGHVMSISSAGLLRWDLDLDPLLTRGVHLGAPVIGTDGTVYVGGGYTGKIFALAVPEPGAAGILALLIFRRRPRSPRIGPN